MGKRKYSKECIEWLRQNANGKSRKELCRLIKEKYDIDCTDLQLAYVMCRNGIKTNNDTRFKTGQNSLNKMPLGAERTVSGGYTMIKIDENTWQYKHRLIYEQAHGIKLNDDEIVIFLDGDITNFSVDNLKVATRQEQIYLVHHQLGKQGKITETGILMARLHESMRKAKGN